jgi:mannose-6-phosphate isomerase-like protein (cupin superfamily)
VRSCRTASVFAMGVVVAVMAAAACRDALSPEIPPVTTASPDAATLRAETSADAAGPSTGAVMAAALAEPPVAAKVIDTPAMIEAGICGRTLMAVVTGKITALSETLGPGDVLVLESSDPFEATGTGTVVWAQAGIAFCPVRSRPAMTKTVVRATAARKLSWAGGTMTARLDVEPPPSTATPAGQPLPVRPPGLAPELYLGRLEGTAPVAEHSHAGSWEILAAIEAKGTLVIDGTEGPLGPRQIVMIPPGTKHAWKPEPGSKLVAVQMYSPPGPEQRFVALAAADRDAGATVKDAGTRDAR